MRRKSTEYESERPRQPRWWQRLLGLLVGALIGGVITWCLAWVVGEIWERFHPVGGGRRRDFVALVHDYLLYDVGDSCYVPLGILLGAIIGATFLPRVFGSRE